MARLIPPAPINRPFVHNAAQPARPRKERRSQRIAEPVEIIDRFEVNIGDFVGSDTEKIKAAVAAAAALDKPAVIKLEHATTYTLTETIAVPKNYILIDLNQAVITRSTDYGPTFTFGYDITDLETYRYTHAQCGIVNGRITAADGTMTSGYHLSFRRVRTPVVKDLFIFNGHSGIELRSCIQSYQDNVYMRFIDRPNNYTNRNGLWIGAHSASDFPGAEHYLSHINIWGGEPWRDTYVGPSLQRGMLIQGSDGIWMNESHIAGTYTANYAVSTNHAHFVGNCSFTGCMSDWCHGQGVSLSAGFGAIVKFQWDGWVSGGPSRFTSQKTVSITKGASGSADTLPDTYIGRVRSVFAGATTYDAGTDYVVNDNTIDWSPAGAEPAPGSTYSVTYTFAPLAVTNDGQGIAITAPAGTPETTWKMEDIEFSGIVEGHSRNGVYISSLNLTRVKLSGLNIATNVKQGEVYGGILIERGSNILINDYIIDGSENARYGLRILPTASGTVNDITIGTGRIKKCEWYGDTDFSGAPGIGVQVVGTAQNVVIDGCNAKDNPLNEVLRGNSGNNFPAEVYNSPNINPVIYTAGWDPGTLTAGEVKSLSITASGVAYGDFVKNASYSQLLVGFVQLTHQCRDDTVLVWLTNTGTTNQTVASGVVTVEVSRNY
jgi:hypothetical protein